MADISSAWFHRLKAAQRDLIKLCGGIQRAAELTSLSTSQVGRFNNATDAEIMPVPAVLILQEDCGQPVFTAAMANLNGRRLADADTDAARVGDLLASHSEVVRTFADMMGESSRALADGRVTPAEMTTWDRTLAAMEQAIAQARRSTAAGKQGGFAIVEGGAK